MSKNNVIDLFSRQRIKGPVKTSPAKKQSKRQKPKGNSGVLDLTQRRQDLINEERRQVKRTILTEFIGAFAVVPKKGLIKVSISDISDQGLAFDLSEDMGEFRLGEEVAMRVYLNHKTYFPFVVRIQNVRKEEQEQVQRHGAHFSKDTVNEEALRHFVKFIESVSASLETDGGDIMVSNLGR